jgi:hypothetical protein
VIAESDRINACRLQFFDPGMHPKRTHQIWASDEGMDRFRFVSRFDSHTGDSATPRLALVVLLCGFRPILHLGDSYHNRGG